MKDLHPDWLATESSPSDEEPVAVHTPSQMAHTRVTRTPAAVAGILMASIAGFVFFEGVSILRGQIAESGSVVVRITPSGFEPVEINADPGDTIEWVNEHTVPQVLGSVEICDEEGFCFSTNAMATGEKWAYDIPLTLAQGSYTYSSLTTPALAGNILVGTGATASGEILLGSGALVGSGTVTASGAVIEEPQEDEVAPEILPEEEEPVIEEPEEVIEEPIVEETPVPSAPIEEEETPEPVNEPSVDVTASIVLPQNPNTVATLGQRVETTHTIPDPVHSGAPPIGNYKPFKHPDTGANQWILGFMSIAAFFVIVRRLLKNTVITK
jgi:plastocyanin